MTKKRASESVLYKKIRSVFRRYNFVSFMTFFSIMKININHG